MLPVTPPTSAGTGLTDQELQDRNLPPLRGPWVLVQREQRTTSPREEAEMALRVIESGYSPWLGGTGTVNYRAGYLGFDRLAALEAPFESSLPLGYNARLTVIAKPVFLDSGQADGTAVIGLTTLGNAPLGAQPEPLGTLISTRANIPNQQSSAGVGGEAQLAFQSLAMAVGYTPADFLVANVTGRMQWRPGNGPFTFNFNRDSVKDSELSYAGLHDPGSATLGFPGNIWGGVIANEGNAQFSHSDRQSGYYFGAGGQYLTGRHVLTNNRINGAGGAFWRLFASPENGDLSIGANFFGMHYAHNEQPYTYGMGGYFSPQAYFLASVPLTWAGHYGARLHYNLTGSLGMHSFQEDLAALFPLDKADETGLGITVGSVTYNNLAFPAKTSVGPSYDLRGQTAYAISEHWFAGAFLIANNTRNYDAVTAGFYVRYLFRPQPSTIAAPTGMFPYDGFRPFTVP
jgi:hypothetical protein